MSSATGDFVSYMANQDSMREVSQQFDIGTLTVHNILKNVFKYFVQNLNM
jgi:DNA-binding CsgD family transcriptional regulator